MIDFSQLDLIWPPIATLLIGLVAGWFLQRFVLVRQMEELETQHLDLLRSAEDEMHAARDEARLQGQKLEEAQLAISLGYERLTLLDRRLQDAETRLVAAPVPDVTAEATSVAPKEELFQRAQIAEQLAFSQRLNELERDLATAKAEALAYAPLTVEIRPGEEQARTIQEREATIVSLRNEVADIEKLRLRLSELVTELGLAQSQLAQVTRERNDLSSRTAAAPIESSNELVRKLADAIARRQELEVALVEANRRAIAAETSAAVAPPRAMAAAAGAGMGFSSGFTSSPAEFPAPPNRHQEAFDAQERLEPAIPKLSPAQLAGGLSQMLFENRIQFSPERADILPDSKLLLEDIADLILSSDPVRLVVEGHTERGDARASYYLSERRAIAVLERLVKLGIPENRMLSVGYGDTRPIDENASHEGRLRNRRIEIRILGRA